MVRASVRGFHLLVVRPRLETRRLVMQSRSPDANKVKVICEYQQTKRREITLLDRTLLKVSLHMMLCSGLTPHQQQLDTRDDTTMLDDSSSVEGTVRQYQTPVQHVVSTHQNTYRNVSRTSRPTYLYLYIRISRRFPRDCRLNIAFILFVSAVESVLSEVG